MNTLRKPFTNLLYPQPLRWLYAAVYVAVLTLVLVQPSGRPLVGPAAPPGPPDLGRELYLTAGHIVGFALLTLVLWWAFRATLPPTRALALAVLIAITLGVVTECAQTLVIDRSASAFDMAANALASIGAAWVIEHAPALR